MDCMTAPLRKTNGRSTREIARGQPRILGQISVGDPVQNFLALKPPADDRGPCAVTLRLRMDIFGNAQHKTLRGYPRASRHLTITRKGHPARKHGHERTACAIPAGLSDPFVGRAPHPQLLLNISRLSSPPRALAAGFRV